MDKFDAQFMPDKTALVVEGGAMRGVFSTGILDGFLANKFKPFDYYLGVSAGASNLAAYLADMPERNLKVYADYALRPEFISLWRFLKGGHLMDLDWLWGITIAELRLDIANIQKAPGEFIVVATDIIKGCPVYLSGNHSDIENRLLASSAIPMFFRRFPEIDGTPMVDGGLADALPVEKAVDLGAKRILVIRSRPAEYQKSSGFPDRYLAKKYPQYPGIKQLLAGRAERYNRAVDVVRNPPAGVEIMEVCLPESLKVARFTKNKAQVYDAYRTGLEMSDQIIRDWNNEKAR